MDIPSWATLILAACLICGEAMSPNPQEQNSLNYNRDVSYRKPINDGDRTVKKISDIRALSVNNVSTIDRVSDYNKYSDIVTSSPHSDTRWGDSDNRQGSDVRYHVDSVDSEVTDRDDIRYLSTESYTSDPYSDIRDRSDSDVRDSHKLRQQDSIIDQYSGNSDIRDRSDSDVRDSHKLREQESIIDQYSGNSDIRDRSDSEVRNSHNIREKDSVIDQYNGNSDRKFIESGNSDREVIKSQNRKEQRGKSRYSEKNDKEVEDAKRKQQEKDEEQKRRRIDAEKEQENVNINWIPLDNGNLEIEEDDGSDNLKAGKSINIFKRYGSLTLTLKVMPSRFSNSWLFREKTSEILLRGSYWEKKNNSYKLDGAFDEHYLIDFCDMPNDLFAAYFDHFEIEGVEEAYKAFTASLTKKKKAQFLGIHPSYLEHDEFSYVLVRLVKIGSTSTLDGDLALSPDFQNATNNIRVGSSESAHQFMDKFGTHVIVEYSLGDVIYQVFVFGPRTYTELKNTFALSYEVLKGNISSDKRANKLLEIREYFTPYLAVNVGEVQMASGHPKFDDIRDQLKKRYFFLRTYQSIFQILNYKDIEKQVMEIKGKVINGMKLRKITRTMASFTPEKYWLSLILDNTLSLYYVSIT